MRRTASASGWFCGRDTPADRRLLAAGEMGETAIASFLAAAARGVQGIVEDYVTCCTAWGFDLREVLGEVHLWHGCARWHWARWHGWAR
jgi:hypothetical protein